MACHGKSWSPYFGELQGLMNQAIATSISMACILPLYVAKTRKLGDGQLMQLFDRSRYMVSIWD